MHRQLPHKIQVRIQNTSQTRTVYKATTLTDTAVPPTYIMPDDLSGALLEQSQTSYVYGSAEITMCGCVPR